MSRTRKTTATDLIGGRVLLGITRLDADGNVVSHEQRHGEVTAVDSSIHIRLSTGADFTLPPDPASFFRAKPGEYRLRSTGEMVVDPDFISTWTIHAPPPGGTPPDHEDSRP